MSTPGTPEDIRELLGSRVAGDGQRWLADALERLRARPETIRTLFPAAGRRCGRGELAPGWGVDDAARALLLAALPLEGERLAGEVAALYRYGDAAERRGVLRGLDVLPRAGQLGVDGVALAHDALRTNDTRLIAAALGPYGAAHLDAPAYRQGVLKCVFLGIPLARVAGLDERADAELARMLTDFAHERVAAGRGVPADVWTVVNRYPDVVEASGLHGELDSAVPERREAAAHALARHQPGQEIPPPRSGEV